MDSGKNNNKGLGEVSFSCYLKTEEENFIHKLTNSADYTIHSITSSPEFSPSRNLQRTQADQEGEIRVFDAEKYYKMKLDEGPRIIDTASDHARQVDLLCSEIKSRPGTPSLSSEASWNSQNALLRTYQRNLSQGNKQKKLHGKGFFSGLSCTGSCTDKKAVHINQNVEFGGLVLGNGYRKERIQSTAHNPIKMKDEFMATQVAKIPIAKSGVQNLAVQKNLAKKIEEEESRKSLDVFGAHTMNKKVIEMNLERKLSMLSWDAIPKAPSLPNSSVRSQVYEDVESDASSDLFEIENISVSTGQAVFRRQTSDGMSSSCMTPTPCELSETSIESSVVTASAANCSVVSDYDEKKLQAENIRTTTRFAKTKSIDKDVMQGSRPSKLLGCKSHKAVRVAETAYRINDKAKPHSHSQQPLRSVAPMPVRKLEADNGELVFDFP